MAKKNLKRTEPLAGKPSAYETGKSHARAGRRPDEYPFDPNDAEALKDFKRGYDDELKAIAKEKAGRPPLLPLDGDADDVGEDYDTGDAD